MRERTVALIDRFETDGARMEHHDPVRALLARPDRAVCENRHAQLRGQYLGETAYIISCGPSMADIWTDEVRAFLADKLVISIKQAYDLTGGITDFHLYNEVRMKAYDYVAPAMLMSVSKYVWDAPSHIHYPVFRYRYPDALFVHNDYEGWALETSYMRPWGVGIMFELGLHLPVYLGCRKVVILGFDMNNQGKYHFYDKADDEDADAYKVDEEEFGYARRSAGCFHAWAAGRGVEVSLYSPLSTLPIPQLTKDEFFTSADA